MEMGAGRIGTVCPDAGTEVGKSMFTNVRWHFWLSDQTWKVSVRRSKTVTVENFDAYELVFTLRATDAVRSEI